MEFAIPIIQVRYQECGTTHHSPYPMYSGGASARIPCTARRKFSISTCSPAISVLYPPAPSREADRALLGGAPTSRGAMSISSGDGKKSGSAAWVCRLNFVGGMTVPLLWRNAGCAERERSVSMVPVEGCVSDERWGMLGR